MKKGDLSSEITKYQYEEHQDIYINRLYVNTHVCNKELEFKDLIPIDRLSLLFYTCYIGDYDMAESLIEYGEDVNVSHQMYFNYKKSTILLFYAVQELKLDLFLFLLRQKNTDLNIVFEGKTVLHEIVENCRNVTDIHIQRKMILELMTYQKFNPNILNEEGESALHLAIQECRYRLVNCLLGYEKVDPNIQTRDDGIAPIHLLAARFRMSTMDSFFKRKDVNINIKSFSGLTAIYAAVRNTVTCCKMVKWLLESDEIDTNVVYLETGLIAIQRFIRSELEDVECAYKFTMLLKKTKDLLCLKEPLGDLPNMKQLYFWNRRLLIGIMVFWNRMCDDCRHFSKLPKELIMTLFTFCECSPPYVYSFLLK